MSEIDLYKINGQSVSRVESQSFTLEKSLQTLMEGNLETFFGVKFLASEYSTGKTHGGRIDTLGLDEDSCPCILEYKKAANQNVINQGLYYLDWLMDHKAEFEILVQKKLGKDQADAIEWSSPRLICIAGDYNKFDIHSVQQIDRNIQLVRYVRFGKDMLLLEAVTTRQSETELDGKPDPVDKSGKKKSKDKTVEDQLANASSELLDLYTSLKETCLGFGDDVQVKPLKLYIAFKKIKNFVTVEVKAGGNFLICYLKLNPDTVKLEEGFIRDVRNVGHWGTGDLEVVLRSQKDLEKALPLLQASYEGA
jgi:predicted transport protein